MNEDLSGELPLLPVREAARGVPRALPAGRVLGREAALRRRLGTRSVVLVGLMGAGKSTIGKRLAARLALPFKDADNEIEAAAGMSVPEIFANYGEPMFRDGERRVIARLLTEGPLILATGGGAFMNEETRTRIAEQGISLWLKADLDVLMRRVRKRTHRPLLNNPDPEGTMRRLIEERHPVYATARVTVISQDAPHEKVVDDVIEALERALDATPAPQNPVQQDAMPQESLTQEAQP